MKSNDKKRAYAPDETELLAVAARARSRKLEIRLNRIGTDHYVAIGTTEAGVQGGPWVNVRESELDVLADAIDRARKALGRIGLSQCGESSTMPPPKRSEAK